MRHRGQVVFSIFAVLILGIYAEAAVITSATIDCSRSAGSVPNSSAKIGEINFKIPVDHILVIMQENHSFDNYFGRLNQPKFYGSEVDGVQTTFSNPDKSGNAVFSFKTTNLCLKDPIHSWNQMHIDWDNGKNDKFVVQNDNTVMAFYDQSDIPYYYELANQFAIADRYFSSVLTSTFPNRYFLLAGTAFGHTKNDLPASAGEFSQKTIFDEMTSAGVSWKYYTDDKGYLQLFKPMYQHNLGKMGKIADYFSDLNKGQLPQVVFIDAAWDGEDEHPTGNIQKGQAWTAKLINGLIASSSWKSSVAFLAYDEGGGFYDHVAPPEACVPDKVAPVLPAGAVKANYDRYGFRVPFVAISPYAKHHFVSHKNYDHTSILKFIETKFNLPALSVRDANADGLMDLFDFANPIVQVKLPEAIVDPARVCK